MSAQRRSKLMPAAEAIAGIQDGAKVIAGGVHFSNTPLALVRELIRRGVRDLEIIPTPATGLWVDMLLAAGAVRKLWVSYIGMEFMGLAHNFRRAVEAERAFLAELGGGCTLPVGAHAVAAPEAGLALTGLVASDDGRVVLRHADRGADPVALGRAVARYLLDEAGAGGLGAWGPPGDAPGVG